MVFPFHIHPDQRIATFRFHGVMTVAKGADTFLAYVHHPGFDPTHAMLCDARAITEVQASFLGIFTRILTLSLELSAFRVPVVSAVLVGDETVFGHVRMLEQILGLSTNIRMVPVWNEAEALDLVGARSGFSPLFAY